MYKVIPMREIEELLKKKYGFSYAMIMNSHTNCYCEDQQWCDCIPESLTLEWDDNIRVVICSTCGALDNERCRTTSGKNTKPHKDRISNHIEIQEMRKEKRNDTGP